MDNIKNDYYYANKIRDDFGFIINHTSSLEDEEIVANEILLDSIMFRLIQVSENSSRLSEDFKKKFIDIPWIAIKGLRNRIVHDYGSVDYSIVLETIRKEIPHCVKLLDEIL